MTFKFGVYTEITDLAFKLNPENEKSGYIRFFICPDVWDTWLVRVVEGYNEDYERVDGVYLLEREKLENDYKGQKLSHRRVKEIIENDEGENWDVTEYIDLDTLIEDIDGGFGILNLKES